jgi:hypothetical protein
MGAELGTARITDKRFLTRIDLTLVYFRVELQGLGGREALVTVLAAIVAAEAGVYTKVS